MSVVRLAGVALAFCLVGQNVQAQERPERPDRERGNFDPEQMRQRMMERYREQLEIKGDDEWKAIEPRVTKVMEARRDVGFGGGFGFRGMGGQRRGGDEGNRDSGRRREFGGTPSPEAEALQKAIEAKASNEEIKTKLAKFREARKAKEANLTKAQDDLRKVLTVRQEASAVMMGLLQ